MRRINEMKYHMGFTVRIYPSYTQKRVISKSDGAQRFVYNKMVAMGKELYDLNKVTIYSESIDSRRDFLKSVFGRHSEMKNMAPFLYDKEIDSLAIMNGIRNYKKAWANFKKNPATGAPVFHKKGYEKRYNTSAQYGSDANHIYDSNVRLVDDSHMKLPVIGRVRFKDSGRAKAILTLPCEAHIGQVTVSMDAVGRYFASFQVGSMEPFHEPLPKNNKAAGYDLGIKRLYTDSDGHSETEPEYYKKAMTKLARAQRRLSRRALVAKRHGKPLGEAKNYQKQRIKVAYIHSHSKEGLS